MKHNLDYRTELGHADNFERQILCNDYIDLQKNYLHKRLTIKKEF